MTQEHGSTPKPKGITKPAAPPPPPAKKTPSSWVHEIIGPGPDVPFMEIAQRHCWPTILPDVTLGDVYLVGKHEENPWQMRALFDRFEDAAACAREHDYFVLRITKNQLLDEADQWTAWYPKRDPLPEGFF